MARSHSYQTTVRWTGNTGAGTRAYRSYSRDHVIAFDGKEPIAGSSDPAFRGDPARTNPEDLLIGSLAACHMLWFLHLASQAGLVVESYVDPAEAEMEMNPDGSGQFTRAVLRPEVVISKGDKNLSAELHEQAHERCFIARSVNFPVLCEPTISREVSTQPG
ncbi:MAG: OsmC family protein [Geminicoccaceae bacterium]